MTVQLNTQRPRVLLAAPSDLLGACLDRIVANGVGSIMVSDNGKVLGIFTERDVLKRWHELPELKDRPIGEVATKPVFCMQIDQLANAPAEMLKRGIRHVPIVDPQGMLVGIMSMRDVLSAQQAAGRLPVLGVTTSKKAAAAAKPLCTGEVHVMTPTAELASICRRYLPDGWKLSVWGDLNGMTVQPVLNNPSALKQTCFVLDLDPFAHQDWKALLRPFIKMLGTESQPTIILVWTPERFDDKDVESLATVATKAQWHAFHRPFAVAALGQELAALARPKS